MKATKVLILASFALMIAACNTSNDPNPVSLVGKWSEPYHVYAYVTTMTFNEDGTMEYIRRPDTTCTPVFADGGWGAILQYAVTEDNKLRFSGKGRHIDYEAQKVDTVPFTFLTDYSVKGSTLTIDSFSCDGGLERNFYKSVVLHKCK